MRMYMRIGPKRIIRTTCAMAVMLVALFAEPIFFTAEGPVIAPMADSTAVPTPLEVKATAAPIEISQTYSPVKITIPEAGVDAEVIAVGVDSQGRMAVPKSRYAVGWYEFGPSPGQTGNALFTAHNRWSRRDAVFARLYMLEPGDEASVTLSDGSVLIYVVETISLYLYNDVPETVMGLSGDERITLITCAGRFSGTLGTSEQRCVAVLKPN